MPSDVHATLKDKGLAEHLSAEIWLAFRYHTRPSLPALILMIQISGSVGADADLANTTRLGFA